MKKSNNKKGFYTLINKVNNEYKNTSLKNISNTVKRNYSFKSKYRNKESATSALTNCSSSKKLSKNSFNNNNNNIIRHDSQMVCDVSDSTFSINNENIEVNEKCNINKNDGFNNQNVQLNYNQYPILDENQNYSRINNENYDKKLKVKINKEDLKYQSIPNDYSYGKVNNNNYSNSLINPYDI